MKKNSLSQRFIAFINKEGLFNSGNRLLIAVSGGVDSVVLCALCKEAGFDFSIAHCNFKLRGEESDGDALFTKHLAAAFDVAYFEKEFETEQFAAAQKLSIQVAARSLRYEWFDSLLKDSKHASGRAFDYLLTAHHADDNMETILMNFFKGSGINGLKGILPKHNGIVRPLLFAKKEDLYLFSVDNKLEYREDSSNSLDKYTRNYFRNELIPGIEKVFPAVKENLTENAERFRDIQLIYRQSVEKIIEKLKTGTGDEIHIPVLKLAKTPGFKTILYELIKEYGFSPAQVEEVIKLLHSESGKYLLSATHRILRNRKWLIISKITSQIQNIVLVEEEDNEIIFGAGKLKIEKQTMPIAITGIPNIAQVDFAKIQFPLLIRKWKQGDYFYPLGMEKKKKLSRFFIDQKLSLDQKQETWVIESNKKIVWIIGHRIDNRFKVLPNSTVLLKIDWLPSK